MSAAKDLNSDEFMRGQRDCQEGEPCPADASESYRRGYAAQYELEQVQGWLSERTD